MKKFDAQACLKALGLEEGGAVQQMVDQTVLDVCEPYVPMDIAGGASGTGLIRSGIENTVIGSGEVVWKTPYAQFVHEGFVYVDRDTGSTGAKKDGRKGPTVRKLQYQGAPIRGSHWFDRSMQDGGIKAVEDAARKALKK